MRKFDVVPGVEFDRDALLAAFAAEQIDSRVFFWPMSMLPMFEAVPANVVSYDLHRRAMNLPSYHDMAKTEMSSVGATGTRNERKEESRANAAGGGRDGEGLGAWEETGMRVRKGPDSGFDKGLVQVAAGCRHYTRHNRRGTVNKWRSGADYLRPYPTIRHGVALGPLIQSVDQMLAAMAAEDWPALDLPLIARTPAPAAGS